MASTYSLEFVDLTIAIPVWEMAIYVGLIGFFMCLRETKGCLLTAYLFALYWMYFNFGPDFLAAAGSNPSIMSVYIAFGLLLAALSLMALFYER
jgi:hypothetical protein